MRICFIGFWWEKKYDYDNFLLDLIKKNITENISIVNNVYEDECDVIFCNVFSSLNNNLIKGHPIIIQYSGEPQINDTYNYDFLIGHVSDSNNSCWFPYILLCGYYFFKNGITEISKEEIIKRKFCSYVASNATKYHREEIVNIVNKIDNVDCGGSHLNNIGYKVPNKIEFINKYNFHLALENTKNDYYITEKILEAFMGRTVPIYYGSTNLIYTFINKDSFINITNMSEEEIIDVIKQCNNVDTIYKYVNSTNILYDSMFYEKRFNTLNNKIIELFDTKTTH